jgi:hypothetical protein
MIQETADLIITVMVINIIVNFAILAAIIISIWVENTK